MEDWGQDKRFENELRAGLEPGERLLWHARAIKRAKRGSWAIFLFAIPWTAFALFWTSMALLMTSGEEGFFRYVFPLFGLPFVLIGVFMLSKPVLSRIASGRMAFGITDSRVIQLYIGKGILTESMPLTRIKSISSFKRSNGSGSLTMKLKKDKSETTRERARSFELGSVPDVANAEKILRDARKRAKEAAKS